MKQKNKPIGHFTLKNATPLDDTAYQLYIKREIELSKGEKSWVYYNQSGFVGSVGSEKFYEQANIIIRGNKLKKICQQI